MRCPDIQTGAVVEWLSGTPGHVPVGCCIVELVRCFSFLLLSYLTFSQPRELCPSLLSNRQVECVSSEQLYISLVLLHYYSWFWVTTYFLFIHILLEEIISRYQKVKEELKSLKRKRKQAEASVSK